MKPRAAVPAEVRIAIATYLRDKRGMLVEIGDAVRTVRRDMAPSQLTDRQLGDLIAAEAVKISCAVFFDACHQNNH
ncbi:hypothetical protein [Sinorhizobium fredii]|uniref:hypothetical protein n=1 Tax=Rhizobium fredii TaxID=380 RepID=UPI000561E0DA|nr:hypothetical protein [Sinorhizobium fredii]